MEAPKRPELPKTAGKDKLVARLKETSSSATARWPSWTTRRSSGKVPFFGQKEISRAAMILATAEDWSDHYSQLAIYLRLNGLLPPTAKKKQA